MAAFGGCTLTDMPPEVRLHIVGFLDRARDVAAARMASRLFAGRSAVAMAIADGAVYTGRLLEAGAPLAVVEQAILGRSHPLGRGFIESAVKGGHLDVLRFVCIVVEVRGRANPFPSFCCSLSPFVAPTAGKKRRKREKEKRPATGKVKKKEMDRSGQIQSIDKSVPTPSSHTPTQSWDATRRTLRDKTLSRGSTTRIPTYPVTSTSTTATTQIAPTHTTGAPFTLPRNWTGSKPSAT